MKSEVERAIENYEAFFIKKPCIGVRKQMGLPIPTLEDIDRVKQQIIFEDKQVIPEKNIGLGLWIGKK